MHKRIKSERFIWLDITITLLALELMAYFYYGPRTLVTAGICIAVSLAAELVALRLMHKKFTADNLSCTSDALITALMLPAAIDMKIPAIACIIAVTAAKNIFGGKNNMIFSPAAVAYLIMYTSWKNDLLSYTAPHTKTGIFEVASELVNSASYTYNHTGSFKATDFELLLGNFSGPVGAVSILLLTVSALILILRRDISAGAFCGSITGTVFMAVICPIYGSSADSVKYILATNMILFASIYIISDKRIAPKGNYYAFFYGLFIALSSYVITLTTGKENVIIIMSVLFTPVSLGFKNLQKWIDNERLSEAEAKVAAEADSIAGLPLNETETDNPEVITDSSAKSGSEFEETAENE